MFSTICFMKEMWTFISKYFLLQCLLGFFFLSLVSHSQHLMVFLSFHSIDDPLKKNATIGFINNFGQIPKQLFKRPHPAKKLSGGPSTPGLSLSLRETPLPCNQKLFFDQLDSLVPSLQPIRGLYFGLWELIKAK